MSQEARPEKPTRRPLIAVAVSATLLAAVSCGSLSTDGALLVSAAMSVAPAVRVIADDYQADHPGTTIRINAGASGVLLQQIRRGAPVDLFISASPEEMDRLEEDGSIERASVAVLASNRLVLVTPRGSGVATSVARDLPRYASIAVANPRTAPLGRYTRQAFEALHLKETLATRTVVGENARQVIEYVARGEVQAGIVYLSDAIMLEGRVDRGPLLPQASHEPIAYAAVIPKNAPRPELAADFLTYLRSPDRAPALARHGFAEAGG